MSGRRFIVEKEGLPDLPGMMLVTIEALKKIGGSGTIHEIDDKVVEIEGASEEEQSYQMGSYDPRSRISYYLSWARTFLRRGGAIENSARGVWSLTDQGEAITKYDQTKAIHTAVNMEERERARQKRLAEKKTKLSVVGEVADTPPQLDEQSSSDWQKELLAVLGAISPSAFERLAQRLMRESGFTRVEVRGKSGDGGIDGVGVLRVNLVSFQVFFQCKRWKGGVGAGEIRDFRGAMQGRADKGLFITTGHFTAQAYDEATRDGATAIDLIDGERLCELLKQNGLGVKTEMIEQVKVDGSWFNSI